jgi:large subunit ribosomal protein L24
MKGIKTVLLSCCIALTLQGCGTMANGKESEMSGKMPTKQHCFGRYVVELPDYMFMYDGVYRFENFSINVMTGVKADRPTIEKDWVKYIKDTIAPDMHKDSVNYGSKLMHQDMQSNPRMIMEYLNTTNTSSSLASLYMFRTFYLRKITENNEWILLDGKTIDLPRPMPEEKLRSEVQRQLNNQMDDINAITYKSWPHNEPGYCLNNEYHYYPGRLEKRDYYHITWQSKVKDSPTFLTVQVESYAKGEEARLESRTSKGKLLQTFFPSTTVKVGGISGELYTSRSSSTPTAREFQWIPDESEAGNRMKPLIKVSGRFDTRDLPPVLRDKVSGEELALWVLESLKMRPGGDEDIRMYGQ